MNGRYRLLISYKVSNRKLSINIYKCIIKVEYKYNINGNDE